MAANSISAVATLGQVALTVADVHCSSCFYRDQVGLRYLFDAGPTLAFLDLGGVRLMLSAPEGEFTPGSSTVLYLKVPDIDAAFQEMRSRDVRFIDEPHLIASMPDHDLWMTFFRDPDGNTLALMCERKR